jgi:hypothetical protein
MTPSRRGANRVCSEGAFGTGGITDEFREGRDRELLVETFGAGGTTESRVNRRREESRVTFACAGGITFSARTGAVSEECSPSADGAAGAAGISGLDLKARRLATVSLEGSLRLGASTTFPESELPRAM